MLVALFAFGGDHAAVSHIHEGSLHPSDFVGVSFWLATAIYWQQQYSFSSNVTELKESGKLP